jgi:hypothetical protein
MSLFNMESKEQLLETVLSYRSFMYIADKHTSLHFLYILMLRCLNY